jgi:hypothetical protein
MVKVLRAQVTSEGTRDSKANTKRLDSACVYESFTWCDSENFEARFMLAAAVGCN